MTVFILIARWLALAFFLYGGAEAINSIDMHVGGIQYLPSNISIKILTALASSAVVLWLLHRHRAASLTRKEE